MSCFQKYGWASQYRTIKPSVISKLPDTIFNNMDFVPLRPLLMSIVITHRISEALDKLTTRAIALDMLKAIWQGVAKRVAT